MNQQQSAINELRETLKPGDTLHTILRHISRSGMSRSISIVKLTPEGPLDLTFMAARAMGERVDRDRGGIKVGGCGMDMGFHIVYSLSYELYPNGHECTGENCPSNDHSNGDRDYTPHHHSDGGYAIRQRWL